MHFYFIINPLSGNGAGPKVWKHLSALLQHEQFSFEYHITGNSGHAKQLAADAAAQAADAVIVLGGDGTLHEAANGLLSCKHFNPEITALSVLPLGTGNDFAAAYGIKKDVQALLTRCKQPKYRWQDVICIKNAADEIHYCVSMAGWGFDAYVARLANAQKAKGKRGKWLYLKAALETVRQYKPVTIQLSKHEKVIEIEMLSGAGGIHRSNGGGLLQCPQALPDDGLIHISIIKPLTLWQIMQAVIRLWNGTIDKHRRVHTLVTEGCTIDSKETVYIEADGEDAGLLPVQMHIEAKRLKVMT